WSLESLKNLRVVSQLQGTAANGATTDPTWLTPRWGEQWWGASLTRQTKPGTSCP
ncbi:hypothetical protein PpBr36_07494, partial [Pyricularia pennisetigena]|uniref:hypothetical protein n=1 Tax=Pyricularia pennisetigena TaxID=1578925 RepID=UPI00115214FF